MDISVSAINTIIYENWIEQQVALLKGEVEFRSWWPQEYWDSLDPALVEYNSWYWKTKWVSREEFEKEYPR